MKYFLDTEFIEGNASQTIYDRLIQRKPVKTIDLISIGLVDENNNEYYAISKDFDLSKAWNTWQVRTGQGDRNNTEPKEYWLRENVLKPIFDDLSDKYETYQRIMMHRIRNRSFRKFKFCYRDMKFLIKTYGLSNDRIAEEVYEFTCLSYAKPANIGGQFSKVIECSDGSAQLQLSPEVVELFDTKHIVFDKPSFYADYASYDWVALMWLFGKMIDKPSEMPYYCNDTQQMLQNKLYELWSVAKLRPGCSTYYNNRRVTLFDSEHLRSVVESDNDFPKNTGLHSAIHDAKYCKALHDYILTMSVSPAMQHISENKRRF
jgi:hypothetical protein